MSGCNVRVAKTVRPAGTAFCFHPDLQTYRPLNNDFDVRYVLETDGPHGALHLFVEPPRDFPEKEGATYRYGPGMHVAGLVRLKSHDRPPTAGDPSALPDSAR